MFQKINPKGYHTKFLENGLRATGRNVETFRPVFINNDKLGSTSASSVVRMGNTIVVCGISTEIGELAIDLPQQGWVVPNLQLDAISLASHKSGLPSSQAQSITFQISQLIKTSDLLDLHSLLIEHSKSAWAIYIDLICLNDDGNLFDAAWLSLVSALRDVKLPKATWDTDAKQVVLDTTMKSPLSLSTILTFTYGFFDDKFILADPDKEERDSALRHHLFCAR